MAGKWRQTTLGDVATFFSGGTPSKANPDYWGGIVPWLSAKDMKTFQIYDTQDHLTDLGASNGTRIAPSGTVLLLSRGMTLLNDVPICLAKRPMAFNQDVKALQAKPGLSRDYLPYLLLHLKPTLRGLVDLAGHGTGRLSTDDLKRIRVSIPDDEEEQNFIAHVLSTLDAKIELNRRMNETLEAMARAIFKSWFVDFDPVRAKASGEPPELICRRLGLTPDLLALFPDRLVDSELGEIPEGWELSSIGDQVDIVGGGTPSTKDRVFWDGGSFHWTTPKDLSGNPDSVLLKTERKITQKGLEAISSGLLPIGTVLLSSRAPVGYLAIAKVPTAINQGFIAMKCHKLLTPEYVLQWANSAMDEIKQRASGTTFAEISKKNFRPIKVVVPTSDVMDAYTSVVRAMYDKIALNVAESDSVGEIRDSLLPKLLSGELLVTEATNE